MPPLEEGGSPVGVDGLLAPLALGFLLGVRHATDADHVVAVSAIVARERSLRAASAIGAMWGVGHTATILGVGGAIILFGVVIPPRIGLGMEFAVALMLIAIGAINLGGTRTTDRAHASDGHAHGAQARARFAVRPLVIGVVHGLAGSAAIALLVLTTLHDARAALAYLVLFGVGTVAGMIGLTTMMAVPLVATTRSRALHASLARLTGALSIGLGLFLAWRIGIADGLFSTTPHWTPE